MTGRSLAHGRALGDERGSTAAEFAIAMPAVLLVLAAVLGGVQVGVLQLRLQDAATDAARSLGRGEPASSVGAGIARQVGGAAWSVSRSDGLVCAHLSARAAPPAGLAGIEASATSCALQEVE